MQFCFDFHSCFCCCLLDSIISVFLSDVVKVEAGIGDKVFSFAYSLITAVGCVVMAILKGWKLALLCLTTTPVTFLLVGLSSKVGNETITFKQIGY